MEGSVATGPSFRIGQYWDAGQPPSYVAELIATFRDRNPDFGHRLFDRPGAERFIAERFGPREAAAFRGCAVPSMQSDVFRYCFCLAHGGVYVDADYRCRRPLRPLLDDLPSGEIFLGPDAHRVNGHDTRRVWSAFMAFREPGHPFLSLSLEIAAANMEARIAERAWPAGHNVRAAIWLTVGPGIPSALLFIRQLGSLDAFVEAVAGTEAEPFADLYCETIGEYHRVAAAFEGLRVSSSERMFEWIGRPSRALPYKETDVHWHNVKTTIFT